MSVKVLLASDIAKLGWYGDVIEVSTGYARNYLLPQGLAILATEANLRSLADEKAKRSEQRMQVLEQLKAIAKAVEGAEAVLAAKANEQGHLFGSVGGSEIAANLRGQGFDIDDEVVQLPERIKQVGTSTVKLKFAEDLIATVNVVVVAKQQGEAAEAKTKDHNQQSGYGVNESDDHEK